MITGAMSWNVPANEQLFSVTSADHPKSAILSPVGSEQQIFWFDVFVNNTNLVDILETEA